MSSLNDWSDPFKATCDRLGFEAVAELRADWLSERPDVAHEPADDVYEPHPDDERWLAANGPSDFLSWLGDQADSYQCRDEPRSNWLGRKIGELYDLARHLDARDAEDFEDKHFALVERVGR